MDAKIFFSRSPQDSCSVSIIDQTLVGYEPDLQSSFSTLFTFMCAGLVELYGETINIADLSEEQMLLIGQYMRALGVDLNIQAKIDIDTKEITALRINFKPLIPMFHGIDKYMVNFE